MATLLPSLILLLAPFAPYLAAELWSETGGTVRCFASRGRLRSRSGPGRGAGSPGAGQRQVARVVRLLPDAGSEDMQQAALAEAKVQAAIAGKQVVKVVVVPGKLINIVVK
jgi:leucyl-tRNA synthetase